MTELHNIFTQAYWWLSFLGGLHCIAIALYVRFSQPRTNANLLFVTLFSLIGWYFLTGLISKGATSFPVHLVIPLLYPSYFLLMPILYGYCKASLYPQTKLNAFKHGLPALIIALFLIVLLAYQWLEAKDLSTTFTAFVPIKHVDIYALLLPSLTLCQALVYFILIWQLIKDYRTHANQLDRDLNRIRFSWINLLVIGILINWLIRIGLIYLPFYAGELPSIEVQAITRLSLLITVYVFAFYGFHQISKAAFLRGLAQANQKQPTSSTKILDADEMAFLQDVLGESKTETRDRTKPPS